jgi:hypothetical protein
MSDKFYITNRTKELMLVTISDTNTGNNVMTRCLLPGTNELDVAGLLSGVYVFHLEDENHEVFYEQKIIKD